ncbi:methylmalonyl-CoA epimerase, mitochondrial-like [Pongo pygmaeus]|uniref:methylmalonyl-CoA epimerase, mitochondrial-like n=1 Tax=Pongo pygmaeus TaxID=9600 RepID=UPI00300DAA12
MAVCNSLHNGCKQGKRAPGNRTTRMRLGQLGISPPKVSGPEHVIVLHIQITFHCIEVNGIALFGYQKSYCYEHYWLFSRLQAPGPTLRAFSVSQPLHQVAGPVWNLGPLNHVAIAVPDLEKAAAFSKNILGAQLSEVVPLPEHGVSVVFVTLGNTKMELLHPLGSECPVAGFLQKNKAGGMHHVCIEIFFH